MVFAERRAGAPARAREARLGLRLDRVAAALAPDERARGRRVGGGGVAAVAARPRPRARRSGADGSYAS